MVLSCHDVSDGGMIVAAAEMCIASGLGLRSKVSQRQDAWFLETAGRYLLEVADAEFFTDLGVARDSPADFVHLAEVTDDGRFEIKVEDEMNTSATVAEMTRAWRGTLDW
jgi:phosphoribosylformylglycinamidine synthase